MDRSLHRDADRVSVVLVRRSGCFYFFVWPSDSSALVQVIVQRTLASKNISHAKGGVLLAGTLKFLPLFLLVIPGMAARVLYKNELGCSDPHKCEQICESRGGCTNIA